MPEPRTIWELCVSCKGSGLQNGMYGVETCHVCRGDCEVRVRDERGRFATRTVEVLP